MGPGSHFLKKVNPAPFHRVSSRILEEPMFARLIHALVASVVVLLPATVLAQGYPTKPIRLIVPFAPGGTNDILGRMVATHLSQTLGQNMIVDNRPGFQGIIGTN